MNVHILIFKDAIALVYMDIHTASFPCHLEWSLQKLFMITNQLHPGPPTYSICRITDTRAVA